MNNKDIRKGMQKLAVLEKKEKGRFPINTIIHGDCIDVMKKLPDNSFDIAIADPPYNVSKGGNWEWNSDAKLAGFGGNWKKVMEQWDDMSLAYYLDFSLAWLVQLKRLIKPSGCIWVHGTYHNIGLVNFAMQLLKVEIINEVIWYKRNSFPNLSARRLTASHESILWAHTGSTKSRKYFFNYEKAKELGFEGDLLKEAGKQMRTVWDVPNNKKREELEFGKHPTQKPIRLIKRMLTISACQGQSLLVPFSGSGTECVAAKSLGINYLGIEKEQEYVELSLNRTKAVDNCLLL